MEHLVFTIIPIDKYLNLRAFSFMQKLHQFGFFDIQEILSISQTITCNTDIEIVSFGKTCYLEANSIFILHQRRFVCDKVVNVITRIFSIIKSVERNSFSIFLNDVSITTTIYYKLIFSFEAYQNCETIILKDEGYVIA